MRLHLRVWPLFMPVKLCSKLEQEFVGSVLSVWMFYVLGWGMYTYTKKNYKKKKRGYMGYSYTYNIANICNMG